MVLNSIHRSFVHGKNFKIGDFCKIHKGVVVGDDVTLQSYVELRPDTKIGDRCYIDSGVKMSGKCLIGNDVIIRYDAIIARNVIIEDNVKIAPQVMFINVPFDKERPDNPTIIHRGAEIGTGAHIHPGVEVGENVNIGSGCEVVKDCLEPGKTYRASSEIVAKLR